MKTLIKNARIVNEGEIFLGELLIENGRIADLGIHPIAVDDETVIIQADGAYLLPGVIDDHVHFREPGLTHKGTIYSESRAAVAGGVTSFMEMPNTIPPTLTQELLEEKFLLAENNAVANYSFYMGVSNTNLEEVLKTDPARVCGLKIFLGASTGNMLVDDNQVLETIFSQTPLLVAVHSEDETIIRENIARYKARFGADVPIHCHPEIRSEQACFTSTRNIIARARKHNTRLHILHLSTEKELSLLDTNIPLQNKRITAEVCVHHLWFSDVSYATLGSRIKWNPAVKTDSDRAALFAGLCNGTIDVVATDHAPHRWEEKDHPYFDCPSGGPLVQHSLVALCDLAKQKGLPMTFVADKMSHSVAECFKIVDRGYLRKGYYADIVLVKDNVEWKVTRDNIRYQCGWSPFEGTRFTHRVTHTFVNGNLVWENGQLHDEVKGKRLEFDR